MCRYERLVWHRARKARVNSLVKVSGQTRHYSIIDYDPSKTSHRYLAVETDGQGRNPRGPATWLDASEFTPTGKPSRVPGRTYRKRERVFGPREMRGPCECLCCAHDTFDGFAEADE